MKGEGKKKENVGFGCFAKLTQHASSIASCSCASGFFYTADRRHFTLHWKATGRRVWESIEGARSCEIAMGAARGA